MIDNQLRSVLFQVPVSGQRQAAWTGRRCRTCFKGVVDLGAIDIERGRDHGMPLYNELRRAFGLTREDVVHRDHRRVDGLVPANDPKITGNPINDPNILDFVTLFDADGNPIALGTRRQMPRPSSAFAARPSPRG